MMFSPFGRQGEGRSLRGRRDRGGHRRRSRVQEPRGTREAERLEQRRLLAFDFVAAFASDSTPFYISGVTPGTQVLQESPQQMTLRFSPGVAIDSSSLDAISMTRLDGGLVKLGSITVNDAPNQNEVILRFAESLPDATYRIDIGAGLASTSTAVGTVNAAHFDVKVEIGAHVLSVVPQPVSRGATGLTQATNQIVVYFNANDPLDSGSAESAANYQLIELDAAGNDTATTLAPSAVDYDVTTGRALLTFASDLPNNKLFRLRVGNDGTAAFAAVNVDEKVGGTDDNSSFGTARNLGTLGTAGATVDGALDVRLTVPTPVGSLPFPSEPGAIDEPGHRDISVNLDPPDGDGVQIINTGEDHGLTNAAAGPAGAVHVQAYNFKSFYGFGTQGQQLYNAISEAQKQRAREIFELYSRYTGIRFVETASDGITVVTGDMRAIDPDIITTPDGLTGTPIDVTGGRVFDVTAIMDATNNWGSSEYGGAWFREAMEQIGHALGLSNSFDIPSIMGPALPGEPVFPGDYDILHAEMLYPNSGTDVDVYRFELPSAGKLVAETFVARPGQPILSKADTVLTLYRQDASGSREMIARNDDSFGTDSFVELDLDGGVYFVAITSAGNIDFNPEIENSGANGRSDGAYELRLNFTPDATAAGTIADDNATLFDGDRDGTPGGVFNFWFRTGDTVFVDKAAPEAGADGSLANPYPTISAAISAVNVANGDGISTNDKQIIRIVGNDAQAPYQIGRNASNVALADGATLNVPRNVTVMIDEGAVFKFSKANIDVGTSAAAASRAGAALQVLGTPANRVTFTSYHDDTIGGNTDGFGPATQGGQWGGIVLRQDSDVAGGRAFLNTIANADIRYGGGQVLVDSRLQTFTPIHLETTRPTIVFNQITNSAGAAISADPNSFEDDGQRVGPEIRGNILEDVKTVQGIGASVAGTSTTVAGAVSTVVAAVTNSTVITLANAVARVGAAVTGVGVLDGTTVTAVSGATVTLSQAVTVAANAVLTFSLANQSLASVLAVAVTDPSQVREGAPVAGAGIPDGTTVATISNSVVTFSQPVTLTQGAVLSFGWAAGQAELRISEPVARVGASLFIDGNDLGLDVSAIDASGTLTLSGDLPQTLVGGSSIGFSFVAGAGAVATSRIRVADLAGITVGGVVSGVPGVPPGTKVVSVTSQSAGVMVELDQRVEVVSGTPIGFGSNSINGLFIRIKTNAGGPIDRLDVPARFKSTDITYVLAENLIVSGGAGGYVDVAIATPRANLVAGSTSFTLPVGTVAASGLTVGMRVTGPGISDRTAVAAIAGDMITVSQQITRSQSQATVTFYQEQARQSGRLTIDPGVILKLDRSRIELERGVSQLFAEGTAGRRVIFTSLADNRFGAGGTFDTNGNQPDKFDQFGRSIDVDGALLLSPTTGDWGGIILNAGAKASIDQAYLAFGGGITPIEGGFDQFNVIEVHQGDLRLANSRIERNAEGLATTDRTGRQGNDSATIFVRGAQPVIIRNDFRDNAGAMISINANSLNDSLMPDPGRGTGTIDRYGDYDANFGPLVRDNRISYLRNTPVTGGAVAAAPAPSSTGSSSSAPAATITQMQWNGQTTSVVANSWVFRAAEESFAIDAGWQARSLGGGFYSMTAPGAGVQDVMAWSQSQSTIDFVEPNFVRTISALPNDPSFSSLWGLENTGQPGGQEGWDFTGGLPTVGVIGADIDAPSAWDVTTGSSNVVVAVIDTGVDYTHEDLAANMWRNPGEIAGNNIDDDGNGFVDDVFGWDFGSNDNDPNDDSADPGHGTHVAGTIGAAGNNGVGVTGVNWNVGIMALKIADDAGNLTTSAIIGAVNYVTMMREQFGVNIVASNNSYGGYGISSAERAAIDAHCAADVIFVAAAGNDSINNDVFPAYPASHNNPLVMSVAATDRANQLARFSNTGPTSVDIAAPGVAILSTTPGNNYEYYGGTSMASPHVAGAVGLLAAAFPNATGAQMRDAILDSAVPVASLANRVATGGLLNVAAALDTLRGTTGISGMVVRGEEITVESVWDDTDIVHVLRSEIVVNNFHTKTGLRLLSQPDESLVVKLQGTTAGFTATGTALDIDDRIGGTVQLVGQPGYPVVLTSLADDTVGVSLDALGRVVRDTNGDGSASTPAPGDWRSLRFEPLSNDRNVAILVEREAGVTGGIDANGTTDEAQVLGTLAPNYATTNDQGTLNSWESAQEKSGDESLRQGFEVHGSVAFDDPTDVDVYTFTGYAGSEVWIDVDNTSPSLDAMVELLDASGTVIARSADSLNDIGVVRVGDANGVRSEIAASAQATVDGVNQAVTGVAALATGVVGRVVGETESVTGVAALSTGVAARVVGSTEAVNGVAALPTGIAALVVGEREDVVGLGARVVGTNTTVSGVATTVTAAVADNSTVDVAAPGVVRIGAAVSGAGIPGGTTVLLVNGNSVTLSQPVTVAANAMLTFAQANQPISNNLVAVADPTQVRVGAGVTGAGVPAGTTVQNITGSVIQLSQPVTLTQGATLTFGWIGNRLGIDEAVADVGASLFIDGVDTGLIVAATDAPGTLLTLGGANGGNLPQPLADGSLVSFSFVGGGTVGTTRIRVADRTGISITGLVNGVNGVPAGTRVAAITNDTAGTGAIITLNQSVDVANGNTLGFGSNATSLTIDTAGFAGQLSAVGITRNGTIVPGVTVQSIVGSTVNVSGGVLDVADGDVLGFAFAGAASVTTNRIRLDTSVDPRNGAAVSINGGAAVGTVASFDAVSRTVTLAGGNTVSVDANDVVGFSFAGGNLLTTRVRVADRTGIVNGVLVNGVAGVPAGTRVVSVTSDAVGLGGTIELDADPSTPGGQPVDVANGDTLGFGSNATTVTIDTTGFGGQLGNVAITRNGTPVLGVAVQSIVGPTVTVSSALDVADGDYLGFAFDGNTAVTTNRIRIDDSVDPTAGAQVLINGIDSTFTVASFDAVSRTVTLAGGNTVSVDANDVVGFSFVGPVNTTRIRVADVSDINIGVLVNGVAGVPAGSRVVSVTTDDVGTGGTVELDADPNTLGSQPVSVANGEVVGFGFLGTAVVVGNAAAIEVNGLVGGAGVTAGTTVANVDPNTNTLTLSQLIDVEDGATLFFGTRSFQLFHQNILPGTLSGVLYLDNTAIQTFTVARDGTFTFTPVGDPAARVIDALATIDYTTGSVRLPFDVVPTGTTRLEVSYEYGRLTRETLGFSATGQGGAMSLAKDDYRGVDMYSTNPRNPGMRVVLPGVTGTETQYFVRVRSQSAYDVATSPAAYETTLANPTGASSGHYELRIRERQQDEKPGSTVRYADLRYPTVGIDVIGLPRNSQLVGETGEMAAANDALGQAQQLGNLLATDRNTISVAGTATNESDIDWYTFTVDFTDIDNITGVNDAAKTWATMFDIDYADGFKGDLTISVFDAAGRLIYVGRDSNITDDQPGENQGNDFDDLSRGSIGVLDPYIGSVQLPAGAPGATTRYYVAISSNERLPTVMNATFQANAANPAIRLEPVSSVRRIVEDHIGTVGYLSNGNQVDPVTGPIIDISNLGEHIQPFTLADVTLFVSQGGAIYTADAFSGGIETRISLYSGGTIGDLDMRTDGRLYQYFRATGDTANRGIIREIDPGSGSIVSTQGDGIRNDAVPADANAPWTITGGSVDALAILRTGTATYNDGYFYSVRDPADGNASILYQGDSSAANSAAAVQNVWYGRRGEIGANLPGGSASIGHTTGMQFRSESGALYGVSDQGFFYQIASGSGNVSNVVDFRSLGITGFQGLASGPVNLEGGRFAGTFFAITDTGRLVCIDPATGSLRTNVFDTNGDGRADSHISNVMLGGATGLAFSPLDINLWHQTNRRNDLILGTPDNARSYSFSDDNTAMYFGLAANDGQGANFGVLSASWRDDLLANPSIGVNYNLPGGAYGSLTTNAFSLAGYESTDKPTLYFSYFLDTQNANSLNGDMLDSARVFASVDNGLTWRLVASNNTTPTNVSSESLGVEVPRIQSVSSAISAHPNQRVQELFDSTGVWRQARVDLGDFAGESNIKLRFDFSTAGEMDDDDRSTSEPDSIQEVAVAPVAGALNDVTLDSTSGLEVGMSVRWGNDQETMLQRTVAASAAASVNVQLTSVNGLVPGMAVTSGVGGAIATIEAVDVATTTITLSRAVTVAANASLFIQRVDPRTTIQAIDAATNTITLSNAVGVGTGSTLNFFRPGLATLRNNLLDNSNVFGNFGRGQGNEIDAVRRGAANQFEGFYIDDIIVGFAERGEMVTGSAADQSFFDIGTPIATLYDAQVLQGEYQLEIRRGTEFAEIVTATTPSSSAVSIYQTFDTNDRLVRAPAGAEIVLERDALTAIGGAIGSFGNGQANPLDLDGDGVPDAIVLQGNGNAANPGDGVALTWSIDLARQPSAFFEIEYATGPNEALRPLPESFLTDADHEIPKGDGVAVSVDGGVSWTTVAQLGVTNDQWRTARIDLVASLARVLGNLPVGQSRLTSQTVIGVFKSGFRQLPAGGIAIRNAIITAAPRTQNVGLVGDSNLPRQQGRFLIENNFIAEASLYGVRIDAARDNGIVSLQPGVARNLPTLNYGRLAPGVVVTNNVIAGSGTAGILFSGDSNSGGSAAPLATVSYGRIVNNTIYGDVDAQNAPQGVGVSVEQSAAPTLLNNLFANLASGILVDGSSIADGLGNSRTVVGYSGFYNVTTEVSAAVTANNSITLPTDPFVAATRSNFYLAPQSRAIDSAIDVLQDRNEFVVVNNQIGIPESPILAPARDIYGQLRSDDPSVAWTGSGLGFNVFKDRGAIDRVDFTQPTIQIAVPLDNSSDDQESARNIVKLISQAARGQLQFVLQLDDVGAGIDKTTVATEAFEIWYSSYPGAPAQQLDDGADYFFRYLETRNQVVFDSAVVFPLGTYEFRVTSQGSDASQSPLLIDLAGNTVLPNAAGGVISFTVSLVDVPAVPSFIRADADEGQVSLEWTAFANGAAITAYELQQSWNGGPWSVNLLTNPLDTVSVRTGLIDGDSYRFRVRATNERGTGAWAEVGPLTPLKVPTVALREDTGVAWDASTLSDHVTRNTLVDVSELLPGATWEYSVDAGGTWDAGIATSFSLSEGTYAAGLIRVRQTLNGATSSVGQNSVVWTIDQTAPAALSGFMVYDNVGLIKKYLRSGETTDDATPFISGTSEASGFVNVGWNVFPFTATAPVALDGTWSLQMPELPDGARSLAFKAMDRAGNESEPVSFDLLIASVLPSVTIDEVRDDQRPVEGAIQPGGSTNDLTPVLTGTAAPNSIVRVVAQYQNQTQALGSVVATPLGNWTLTAPALNIASGTVPVAFEATVTDSVGRVGTSGSYPIVVDLQAPVAPSITAAADNVGSVTGPVVSGGTSDDFTPTLSGTREAGTTINVLVTLPSGQNTLPQPVVPAANGNWSWTPSAAFTTAGTHIFRAIATDAAGNSSPVSAPFTINLQGTPGTPTTPEPQQPPTITAVATGGGAIANNGSTTSASLTLGGTAPAGSTVIVRDGGVEIARTTALSDGTWAQPLENLAATTHQFRAEVNGLVSTTLTITVTNPAVGGTPIAVTGVWGPAAPGGGSTIYLDFNQAVNGVSLEVVTILHRGRSVSLRGGSVTTTNGGQRYVISLPTRLRTGSGAYEIMLAHELIRSVLDPNTTLDPDESRVTLPDAGMA